MVPLNPTPAYSGYGSYGAAGYPQGPPNRPHRQNGNARYASYSGNPQVGYGYGTPNGRTVSGSTFSTLDPHDSVSNLIPAWALPHNAAANAYKALGPAAGIPLSHADDRWNREIFQTFDMVKDWVALHCNKINEEVIARLPATAPTLWGYVCQVTFPNNHHFAVNHSRMILNDHMMRPYFVARLVIQFVVQQMWGPDVWEGVDETLALRLRNVRAEVERAKHFGKVLSCAERYAHVNTIGRAINEFLAGPEATRRKSQMVTAMSLRLKNIIGPLMNPDTDRESAMWELNMIGEQAVRVSALINTSRLSFSFIFNESGVKFSEQSHYALNSNVAPKELQHRQWRVSCVITPGITYRDDASGSVDPKFIAKANVLVMN